MRMPAQPAIVYVHYWAGLMMRRFIDTAEDAIDIVLKVNPPCLSGQRFECPLCVMAHAGGCTASQATRSTTGSGVACLLAVGDPCLTLHLSAVLWCDRLLYAGRATPGC